MSGFSAFPTNRTPWVTEATISTTLRSCAASIVTSTPVMRP
jgi:hypothetical protein